ncbi:RidA family protein [Ramlibacter albus]|uniref:RidA family protein n=1 Tax=Ramlibacter albus TaxID=2079448 RepID=A0A923MDH1_9BURK|nr:RidA family protein [Ramlibacter albus]MBC5767428.1 RidA family protein [Ramlibacter albus]
MNHTPIPVNVPKPLGAYEAVVVRGGVGRVSGQFPIRDGKVVNAGVVGHTLDLAQAREAARIAALNVLGQIRNAVGLDGVELLHVDGCIAAAPGCAVLPQVLDGASEIFVELLGEAGHHTRGLIPVASLPGGAAIELLATFHLTPNPPEKTP